MKEIQITSNEAEQRLDRFIKKLLPDAPHGVIYKHLRTRKIKVNGKKVKEDYRLQVGDLVQLYLEVGGEEGRKEKEVIDYPQEFQVVFEDENVLIVDKPAGLLVHSDEPGPQNTLDAQVLAFLKRQGSYDPNREITFTPAPANRLDRNTSGLVLFGKNYLALQALNEMVRQGLIRKYYLALVYGKMEGEQELEGYLLKDEDDNKVTIFDYMLEGSLPIHTRYRAVASSGGFTLLEVELITGRSHQIRAHLASIGHPVAGDPKYAESEMRKIVREKWGLKSQFLHAYRLIFQDTVRQLDYLKGREIQSKLPRELQNIANMLKLSLD